jgi:hypothetical protein
MAPFAGAAVMWSNSNGVATSFTWENGGSDNGLYGDPTLVGGNTLVFFPSGFRAESNNGVTDSVSDRLFVDIIANPGQKLTEIVISELGDYGIVGAGSVNLLATLDITDLLNPMRTESDMLTANPTMPIVAGSGNWSASGGVLFSMAPGEEWTHIRLELTNLLEAFSSAGSSSFIEKKVAGTGIQIMVIPTPGAAALLAMGGLACSRRRRA